jgi:outer membrane immunogenic protein
MLSDIQSSYEGVAMKKTLIASVMLGALAAGSAMAADMAVKAPIMRAPPMPVFSWTGCYIAGDIGYGMWNQETFQVINATGAQRTPTETGGGRGWFGGGQVGCDYQIASSWVIGAQADWDWANLKGSPNFGSGNIGDEKNDWTWAAGGRIGYVVMPQLLAYVSGGYTQAHFAAVSFVSDFSGLPDNLFINDHTYSGWYLGSGYEYGVSFLPGLFWKTEYRYSEFQADVLPHLFVSTGLANGFSSNSKKFTQTIRSELVWRFNWFH